LAVMAHGLLAGRLALVTGTGFVCKLLIVSLQRFTLSRCATPILASIILAVDRRSCC